MGRRRPFSLVELIVAFSLVAMGMALLIRPTYLAMNRLRFDYAQKALREKAKAACIEANTREQTQRIDLRFSQGRLFFEGGGSSVIIDGVMQVFLDGKPLKKERLEVYPRVGFEKRRLVIEGPKEAHIDLGA